MADMPETEQNEENEEVIIPHFKMILSYDVLPNNHDNYYQFILGEMVPAMQEMGVYMTEAWHTAYGEYPIRMVSFVSEEIETINNMLSSDRWNDLETRLMSYIRNYSRKVIEYRQGFQFISKS